MNLTDLDGNPLELKLSNKILYKKKTKFSNLHKKALEILKRKFPTFQIYEDVPVRVQSDKLLFIDLFLVELNIAVEVHGKQHYQYTSLFHKNKLQFLQHQQNDKLKQEWFKLNNIKYIELPYNESIKEWEKRLNEY